MSHTIYEKYLRAVQMDGDKKNDKQGGMKDDRMGSSHDNNDKKSSGNSSGWK